LNGAQLRGADLHYYDLSEAVLSNADLSKVNLCEANLCDADLRKSKLHRAVFIGTNLRNANLARCVGRQSDFSGTTLAWAEFEASELRDANFSGAFMEYCQFVDADLTGSVFTDCWLKGARFLRTRLHFTKLFGTDLTDADFTGSDLTMSDLRKSRLVNTNFTKAVISRCHVYGAAVWGVILNDTHQEDLVITQMPEPTITVDDLEVAQFIHLMLNNNRIREVLDAIASRVVLILGRFTPQRKRVLDRIRNELRRRNYSPVLFDFDKPTHRDMTETISILAHISRFVVADLTDARSVREELMRIVPALPSVPVLPLLHNSGKANPMFEHLARYPSMLDVVHYRNSGQLIKEFGARIIKPCEDRADELSDRLSLTREKLARPVRRKRKTR
jgi:uncharacterized protein YjbI with pentapeptide repeats